MAVLPQVKSINNQHLGIANVNLMHPMKHPDDLRSGDICTVVSASGGFKIAKVLVVDQNAVHIKLYKDRFSEPPTGVDTAKLSLGTVHDPDGFGIGHLPLSRDTFAAWAPVRIQSESVTHEELENYRMWEEAKGGTIG